MCMMGRMKTHVPGFWSVKGVMECSWTFIEAMSAAVDRDNEGYVWGMGLRYGGGGRIDFIDCPAIGCAVTKI